MATFVLVHGAWGGSYGWHKLAPLLRAAGHDVFTPSLTGLGERSHLAGPQVNLTTHVLDVANCLYFNDLSEIVLVGHSYGGMVITGVIDSAGERVRDLVYLDAFVPDDGQSLYDLAGASALERESEDWQIPPMPRSLPDRAEETWLSERRRPQPRGCFTEKVRLALPLAQQPFSRTYIKATADARENAAERRSGFWQAADRLRSSPAWRYREISTSHMVQNEKPEELAKLLLEVLPS